MQTKDNPTLTVETTVQQPVEKVWQIWEAPEHIVQWNFAHESWQCPAATNDLKPGGRFVWRMEARDGTVGFDYAGTYEHVVPHKSIVLKLDDGRKVSISFESLGDQTKVTEVFEVEDVNTIELQRNGWQAILDNFKKHAESQK